LSLPKLRTIRQEPGFDEGLECLAISHTRLDEVLASATFFLSRHPELCHKVPGTSVRVFKTPVYPDAPSVRIFFKILEDVVALIHIEFCEDVDPVLHYTEDDPK
jgi:hypothetical protein